MKKLLIAALLSSQVFSATVRESFFINDPGQVHLDIIKKQRELTLDHLSPRGYELYGPKGTKKWLENIGADFFNIAITAANTINSAAGGYPSSAQINEQLRKIVKSNPAIFSLIIIGKSEEGQELIVIKISDNVEVDEFEPEVKLVANMHGNEIMGREVLLQFLEDIAQNYHTDSDLKNIVDNTEIFVMPSLNPDGADKKRRGNANWVDLNRHFPDFSKPLKSTSFKKTQSEVAAMMKFQAARNFSLSFNYHGGAVVVNYPWDTIKELHPENDLVIELSKNYATSTSYFLKESNFTDAIVNGYQWYEVNGGMQDWSYHWFNDLQVTIEVSSRKWPNYRKRSFFYQENRLAIINFIKSAQTGFGLELDENGIIKIEKMNSSGDYLSIGNFQTYHQEFYKVLAPGNYRYTFKNSTSTFTL